MLIRVCYRFRLRLLAKKAGFGLRSFFFFLLIKNSIAHEKDDDHKSSQEVLKMFNLDGNCFFERTKEQIVEVFQKLRKKERKRYGYSIWEKSKIVQGNILEEASLQKKRHDHILARQKGYSKTI